MSDDINEVLQPISPVLYVTAGITTLLRLGAMLLALAMAFSLFWVLRKVIFEKCLCCCPSSMRCACLDVAAHKPKISTNRTLAALIIHDAFAISAMMMTDTAVTLGYLGVIRNRSLLKGAYMASTLTYYGTFIGSLVYGYCRMPRVQKVSKSKWRRRCAFIALLCGWVVGAIICVPLFSKTLDVHYSIEMGIFVIVFDDTTERYLLHLPVSITSFVAWLLHTAMFVKAVRKLYHKQNPQTNVTPEQQAMHAAQRRRKLFNLSLVYLATTVTCLGMAASQAYRYSKPEGDLIFGVFYLFVNSLWIYSSIPLLCSTSPNHRAIIEKFFCRQRWQDRRRNATLSVAPPTRGRKNDEEDVKEDDDEEEDEAARQSIPLLSLPGPSRDRTAPVEPSFDEPTCSTMMKVSVVVHQPPSQHGHAVELLEESLESEEQETWV